MVRRSSLPHPLLFAGVLAMVLATLFGPSIGMRPVLPGLDDAELGAGPSPLAPREPAQRALQSPAEVALWDGYVARAHHAFDIEALVLSRHDYRFGRAAAVSPMDLALGWGPMSAPDTIRTLRFRQGGRFAHIRPRRDADVDVEMRALLPFWSNVHLVPSTPEVRAALDAVRPGDVVRLRGSLADVEGPNFHWRSSTTRFDTGAGACEIVLVAAVEITRPGRADG